MDLDIIEESFFRQGNPLRKLLKISLTLFNARQTGILYGTNSSHSKFLPTSLWDRGIMDKFDGPGITGWVLKVFGKWIVTAKNLSPVYFYTLDDTGKKKLNDGIISYVLRNYADYYSKGISVLICPYPVDRIRKTREQYLSVPLYSYNGVRIQKPEDKIKIDIRIVRQFESNNSIYIYLPSYGILVVNTADERLLEMEGNTFLQEAELKQRLDLLIRLVETASLAYLGQLKGKRGAELLWRKESHLREAAAQSIENERKFRDLYENAPIAYFSMDGSGSIIQSNSRAESLSGFSRDELKGRSVVHLLADKMEMTQKRRFIAKCIEQDQPIKDLELMITRKSGEDVWISLSLEAVKDKAGEITELRAMAVDISKRKGLERQLLHSQKMEALGTLSRGIAHDFNNIIAPIYGYSQLLLMDIQEENLLKQNIEIIHNCAVHAKDLVQQMLTFSKQKADGFKAVAVDKAVNQAVELARAFLPATIRIEADIESDCGCVLGDPVQINQVVMNLVTNAMHAMDDGGGVLKIVLEKKNLTHIEGEHENMVPQNYIYLMVGDTGSGIDEHLMENIFDPYFSTKKEGKGSGIGLSVVHGIITSLDGYIHVQSQKGKGSQFHVYLPLHDGPATDHVKIPSADKILKGSERILLVEDDSAVAVMVKQMLEKLGYQVTIHTNSQEGCAAFLEQPAGFDVVVTDLTMPGMTGIELARHINEKSEHVPVIICTGFGEGLDKNPCGEHGVKALLKKPVSIKDFSVTLRKVLEHA